MKEQHQTMIGRVVEEIRGDHRFLGVLVGGSYLTDSMDEFSDLDFILVSEDSYYEEIMNARMEIVQRFGTILSGFTGEHVGEPRLIICLYDNPVLHVDFKFITVDALAERIEDPAVLYAKDRRIQKVLGESKAKFPVHGLQWIEDRFWVWIHYGATKIGRGELFETMDLLAFLRREVLAPMLAMRRGKLPRGVRKIEKETPEDGVALEKTTALHDRESCIAALYAAAALYRDCRMPDGKGVFYRKEAEKKAVTYLEQVSACAVSADS